MKENSIKEDIERLKLCSTNQCNICGRYEKEECMLERNRCEQHILSDYKRVLKENELLRKDIEGWKKYCEEIEEEQTEMSNKNCQLEFDIEKLQKENEELKQDRNNNYKIIALAQNEALGYMRGYEDGKKLKKSALSYIEENQQYYIIKKKFEHYEERIVKLLKENEKLKNQEATARKINELLVQRYSNSIPVQKVKDKIEEIQEEGYWLFTTDRDSDKCVEVLQQLYGKEQ